MTTTLETTSLSSPVVERKVSPIKTAKIGLPEVQKYMEQIRQQMEDAQWYPEAIIGIVKGGAVPATMLSHQLEQPVTFYLTPQQARVHLAENATAKILVIDDICDSGHTFVNIGRAHSNHKFAALIENTDQSFRLDFAGAQISRNQQDAWFEFFWETGKSSRNPSPQVRREKFPSYPDPASLSLTLQMLGTLPDLRNWFFSLCHEPSLVRRQSIYTKAQSIRNFYGEVGSRAVLILTQTRIFETVRMQLIEMERRH